jgi:hypothetical protein
MTQTVSEEFKKPDISMLNQYYLDADSADQSIFAEMRSNLLLVSGDHYNKNQNSFYKRLRDNKEISQEQKIRLTKNHVQNICNIYANNISSTNPGVCFNPKEETSNHDQKVAQMHTSVWRDAVDRYKIDDRSDDWVDAFIQAGELAVKLFYDPDQGKLKGYEAQIDQATGQSLTDEMGQEQPDENKPVMEGGFVFEDIFAANLLRPAECKNMQLAEWLGIRKMSDLDVLKRKYSGQPEKLKHLSSSPDETYNVFDISTGGFKKTSKQTMIREYYFRPSRLFPKGYFYITTKDGILEEGELPGGLFPIVFAACIRLQTTPRGRSPIKIMRPYQAEINRSASKMAEHQITLGDDKLLIQNGTKISAGIALPGVRSMNFTGMTPTILAGRDGSQYLEYMKSQITELYQTMAVQEMQQDSETNLDPYVLLFRSARQKKKFQRYIKRYENFLVDLSRLYLSLAKVHLSDDAVIWAVGKNEQVNIAEYKQLPDLCYEIDVEPQSEDIETKLGKQIVLNHALQYIGPQLKPDEVGKFLRQMPFANFDEDMEDLTLDYDGVKNDILALDRGEQPPLNQYDNHEYCIKKLTSRTKKADYRFLDDTIKQNYQGKIQLHMQMDAANKAAILRAEQGLIPTDGYLVGCDFFVPDPTSKEGKTRRARIPYMSLDWLIKQLEVQGASQDKLKDMSEGAQAQIADETMQQSGMMPQPMAGQPY